MKINNKGQSKNRLYKTWSHMVTYNNQGKYYMDSNWKNNFEAFKNWAINNSYADNLMIRQIIPKLGYYPENCKFVLDTQSKKWTDIEIEYLKSNFEIKTFTQIGKEINKSSSAVARKAKQLKLIRNVLISKNNRLISSYYQECKIKVGEIFNNWQIININGNDKNNNRLCDCICLLCGKLINKRLLTSIVNGSSTKCLDCANNQKCKGNLLPLLEDNHLAYYYHGLIYADGSIYRHLSGDFNILSIGLQISDKEYLQKFANLLSTNTHVVKSNKENEQDIIRIGIQHKFLVPKLAKILDIWDSKKTYYPPQYRNLNWNRERRLSVACGFIDGDGSKIENSRNFSISSYITWFDMHKFLFEGLYSSLQPFIRERENHHIEYGVDCFIHKEGFDILNNHRLKYNLPVLERKWQ